jgi:hypothetical protein
MFVAVIVRRLRPGKTRDDFVRAWYPDKGFGVPGRGPILATDVADERQIVTLAFVDLPDRAALGTALERLADQEALRRDRVAEVIESTSVQGIFEVDAEFDFATDESVERGRPAAAGDA